MYYYAVTYYTNKIINKIIVNYNLSTQNTSLHNVSGKYKTCNTKTNKS